jgi:phage I-like protein
MCSLEWTGAGRAAIEGKDFFYFSPSFLLDEDGFPEHIKARLAKDELENYVVTGDQASERVDTP